MIIPIVADIIDISVLAFEGEKYYKLTTILTGYGHKARVAGYKVRSDIV